MLLCFYRPHVDVKKLSRNTKLVAEALARVIYNLTEKVNAQTEEMMRLQSLPPSRLGFDISAVVCTVLHRGLPGTCRSSLNRW